MRFKDIISKVYDFSKHSVFFRGRVKKIKNASDIAINILKINRNNNQTDE